MESVIEAKTGFFETLGKYPEHIPVYIVALVFFVLIIALIKNPNLINNLLNILHVKKEQPVNERRRSKRRKDDVIKEETTIEQLNSLRKELKEQFKTVSESIEKLFSITTHLDTFIRSVSQGTLENMLLIDKQSVHNRLKAFVRLIAMGVNGDVKKEGIKLALEYKEIWKIVMRELKDMNLKIVNQKYFDEVINEINLVVFSSKVA